MEITMVEIRLLDWGESVSECVWFSGGLTKPVLENVGPLEHRHWLVAR